MGFENLHFDFMLSEAKGVFSVFSKPSGNYICVTKSLFFDIRYFIRAFEFLVD